MCLGKLGTALFLLSQMATNVLEKKKPTLTTYSLEYGLEAPGHLSNFAHHHRVSFLYKLEVKDVTGRE